MLIQAGKTAWADHGIVAIDPADGLPPTVLIGVNQYHGSNADVRPARGLCTPEAVGSMPGHVRCRCLPKQGENRGPTTQAPAEGRETPGARQDDFVQDVDELVELLDDVIRCARKAPHITEDLTTKAKRSIWSLRSRNHAEVSGHVLTRLANNLDRGLEVVRSCPDILVGYATGARHELASARLKYLAEHGED